MRKKQLNEGPGAGYTISGEIDNFAITDFSVVGEEETNYGKLFDIECNIACEITDLVSESYDYSGKIDSTPATITSLLLSSYPENNDAPTEENVNNLLQGLKFKVVYGGGWSHSKFENDLELDYNNCDEGYDDVFDLDGLSIKFDDPKTVEYIDKYATGENRETMFVVETKDFDSLEEFDTEEDAIAYAEKDSDAHTVRETAYVYAYDGELEDIVDIEDINVVWTKGKFEESLTPTKKLRESKEVGFDFLDVLEDKLRKIDLGGLHDDVRIVTRYDRMTDPNVKFSINWAGLGAQSVEETEKFIDKLNRAVKIVKKLNARGFVYKQQPTVSDAEYEKIKDEVDNLLKENLKITKKLTESYRESIVDSLRELGDNFFKVSDMFDGDNEEGIDLNDFTESYPFDKSFDQVAWDFANWVEDVETGAGDRHTFKINDSLKESKKLHETYDGEEAINSLVERAKSYIDDDYDIDEAVGAALDDGLIYTRDIRALADHYDVIPDDTELIGAFWESLFNDVYSKCVDYFDEIHSKEDEEEFEESFNAIKSLVERRGQKFIYDEDETNADMKKIKKLYNEGGAVALISKPWKVVKKEFPEFAHWFERYHEAMEGNEKGELDKNSTPIAEYWEFLEDADIKAVFDYIDHRAKMPPDAYYVKYADKWDSGVDETEFMIKPEGWKD